MFSKRNILGGSRLTTISLRAEKANTKQPSLRYIKPFVRKPILGDKLSRDKNVG